MVRCEDCAHFRPERSLSESLRLPDTQGTASVYQEIVRNDQSLRIRESEHKLMLAQNNREEWPFRPKVLAYCGLREDHGVYLAHQVKNDGLDCEDFVDRGHQSSRTCETCQHFQAASGPVEDSRLKTEVLMGGTLTGGMEGRSDPDRLKRELDIINSSSQARQAVEMTQAMHGGGTLPSPPRYYDYCRRYSTSNEYVLCRVKNSDGRCKGWQGQSSNPGGPSREGFWPGPWGGEF